MRPVPLAVDLVLTRADDAVWPDCSVMAAPWSYDCLYSLNAALTLAVGVGGWQFEWLALCGATVMEVPAVFESVTASTYPRPGVPARAAVTVSVALRTAVVPTEGAAGDLGERVAGRLEGAVWRYPGGEAAVAVSAVRFADPLRDPLELYRATVEEMCRRA